MYPCYNHPAELSSTQSPDHQRHLKNNKYESFLNHVNWPLGNLWSVKLLMLLSSENSFLHNIKISKKKILSERETGQERDQQHKQIKSDIKGHNQRQAGVELSGEVTGPWLMGDNRVRTKGRNVTTAGVSVCVCFVIHFLSWWTMGLGDQTCSRGSLLPVVLTLPVSSTTDLSSSRVMTLQTTTDWI